MRGMSEPAPHTSRHTSHHTSHRRTHGHTHRHASQNTTQRTSQCTPQSASQNTSHDRVSGFWNLKAARLTAAITGFLGMVLFILAPFLPVNQTTATVTWPQHKSVKSVEAPLIAHSPQSISLDVPFSAIQAMKGQKDGIIASTLPGQSLQATQRGLFIRVSEHTVDVLSRDTPFLTLHRSEVEAAHDGTIHIEVDKDGARARVTGLGNPVTFTSDDAHLRPITMGIFSDLPLDTPQAAVQGMKVTVHIDTRFTTSPTLVKLLAMIIGVICMILSWIALARIDAIVQPTPHTPTGYRRPDGTIRSHWSSFTALDAVVYIILLIWHFIGANTSDDGYIHTMVRVANQGAGYMANYYRWYGVTESPFGSPYYDILKGFAAANPTSPFVRLPALICAVLTWMLISKSIIPRLGEGLYKRKITTWTAAGVFLIFHMAFNNGMRPEPFVAMMALLTWALLEKSIATHRMLPATISVLTAALALSGNPTGLMAVAALVAAIRPLLHVMRERRPRVGVAAQIGPIAASGFAVLTCVFGDHNIGAVREATRVRGDIGPNMPWYREVLRYFWLTIQTVDGSMSRRIAVFTMLFCLIVVTVVLLRNRKITGADPGPSWRALGITYGTLILMMFSPTKWTHHFGAYAGIAPILAALAALAIGNTALRSSRNRSLVLGAMGFVLAFSLATVNDWWFVSHYHIPWFDKVPQIHGVELFKIVMVIAIIAFLVAGWQHMTQDFRPPKEPSTAKGRERLRILGAAPVTIVAWLTVAFYLLTFGKAAISQYPAYSVAKGNMDVLAGHKCMMADNILVEPDPNKGMLTPLPHQEWERTPQDGNTIARGPLAGPTTKNFEAWGVPDHIEADPVYIQQGTAGTDYKAELPSLTKQSGQQGGIDGGVETDLGVNGSHAKLPFGLNPKTTPVLGSYQYGMQHSATLQTAWYSLPKADDAHPVIVFTAAGRLKFLNVNGNESYGQPVYLQYGVTQPDGSLKMLGQVLPYDVGPIPAWRNMRIPRSAIPAEANAVRLVGEDTNLDPDHWVAVTPPRLPHLVTLQNYVGSDDPTLLDWEIALQFPCIHPYSHYAGVTERPKWRISPDRESTVNNTDTWQATKFGGSLGITEGLSSDEEVPTYLKDDWGREWGSLKRLTPYGTRQPGLPVRADIQYGTEKRSGLWNPGKMNIG